MASFAIGLSGIRASQKALDVVANNIANAATEGYHRQRVDFAPAYMIENGPSMLGGGVKVVGIRREIDNLLERQILSQMSNMTELSQQYDMLRNIESSFGEFANGGGLNQILDDFFLSLHDLTAHPGEYVWQNKALYSAQAMTAKFRGLDDYLSNLDLHVTNEATQLIAKVNIISDKIASLNSQIEEMEMGGTQSSALVDQRDQYISELSTIMGVEVQRREYGVVNVVAGRAIPLVVGASVSQLEVGLDADGKLGVALVGSDNFNPEFSGGELGGLLVMKNQLITEIRTQLDTLASGMITNFNKMHVQGLGSHGSFTELTGWRITGDLASQVPPVVDGKIYIRRTNTTTGEVTRHEIDVNATNDSLSDVAARINAVTGITSFVSNATLKIEADAGYKFDFLPGVLTTPTTTNLGVTASVSGIYSGTDTQTYTCTVVGTGTVGVTAGLKVEVRIGATVIDNINIGEGYEADSLLDIGGGINISLASGNVTNGQVMTVEALASSDTSDFLAATGMNTFFGGNKASNISVCSAIVNDPGQIASSLGASYNDNQNITKMMGLSTTGMSALGGITPGEYYRNIVTELGQKIYLKEIEVKNMEVVMHNLKMQQSEVSGVDINDETAKMMMYEQMFQGMAKYINTVQSTLEALMDVL